MLGWVEQMARAETRRARKMTDNDGATAIMTQLRKRGTPITMVTPLRPYLAREYSLRCRNVNYIIFIFYYCKSFYHLNAFTLLTSILRWCRLVDLLSGTVSLSTRPPRTQLLVLDQLHPGVEEWELKADQPSIQCWMRSMMRRTLQQTINYNNLISMINTWRFTWGNILYFLLVGEHNDNIL